MAIIGKDAARAWEEIGFLHHCTDLEVNAKWWHHLKTLDIEFDQKPFQRDSRDVSYLQRLIPSLLKTSEMSLELVLSFTRQYMISDSIPCILYVEGLLLLKEHDLTAKIIHHDKMNYEMDYQDKIAAVLEDIQEKHVGTYKRCTINNTNE